jgi:hypothetical protein
MDREEIIRMALESGLERNGYWEFDLVRLERFSALVAAAEREACAKVCEDWDSDAADPRDVASAIRARGEK